MAFQQNGFQQNAFQIGILSGASAPVGSTDGFLWRRATTHQDTWEPNRNLLLTLPPTFATRREPQFSLQRPLFANRDNDLAPNLLIRVVAVVVPPFSVKDSDFARAKNARLFDDVQRSLVLQTLPPPPPFTIDSWTDDRVHVAANRDEAQSPNLLIRGVTATQPPFKAIDTDIARARRGNLFDEIQRNLLLVLPYVAADRREPAYSLPPAPRPIRVEDQPPNLILRATPTVPIPIGETSADSITRRGRTSEEQTPNLPLRLAPTVTQRPFVNVDDQTAGRNRPDRDGIFADSLTFLNVPADTIVGPTNDDVLRPHVNRYDDTKPSNLLAFPPSPPAVRLPGQTDYQVGQRQVPERDIWEPQRNVLLFPPVSSLRIPGQIDQDVGRRHVPQRDTWEPQRNVLLFPPPQRIAPTMEQEVGRRHVPQRDTWEPQRNILLFPPSGSVVTTTVYATVRFGATVREVVIFGQTQPEDVRFAAYQDEEAKF